MVAAPDGRVRLSSAGDQRLATAGTGDVLAGVIGAALALGEGGALTTVAGVHVHGTAAMGGPATGFRAGDLPKLVGAALDDLVRWHVRAASRLTWQRSLTMRPCWPGWRVEQGCAPS